MQDTDHPKSSGKSHPLSRFLFFLKFLEIRLRFIAILIITAVVVGYWDTIQNYYERWEREHAQSSNHSAHEQVPAQQEFEFYCGMHPFVVRDREGKCPICGMDLVQRKKGEAVALPEGTLTRVQVSPQRVMQGGIQVEPVLYRTLTRTIRSYGVVEPAEGRIAKIVARFPGRVQDLLVNAVGMTVKKGDPLARIYSPKYLAASQEYVRAAANQQKTPDISNPEMAALEKNRAEQLSTAARKRLALAGFTEDQLNTIAESGKVSDTVTLNAPLAGTVIEKNVLQGEAVEESSTLFTVADLSTLWVQVKVLEADIAAIKLAMPVEITTIAWPGVIFYGNIDFLYPVLNAENRSINVRVTVANPEGKLKPGMFANAIIRSPVGAFSEDNASQKDTAPPHSHATSAAVTLPTSVQDQADAYIAALANGADYYQCPMDANVVSDKADECPVCGMKLEKKQKETAPLVAGKDNGSMERWTEGYACPMHPDELSDKPGICTTCNCGMKMVHWRVERVLSVPESAVIDTGAKKVVYIESSSGVFDAHAVTLGSRTGVYYPVLDGLTAGQRIATQGAFLIDAEARLNPAVVKTPDAGTHPH